MEKEARNIIERVSQLYRQYGIKSVTMDDVARELGISKKTLYEYFNDKEDLVSSVVIAEIESQKEILDKLKDKKLNAIEELFQYYKHANVHIQNYSPTEEYDLRKYYPELYKKIMNIKRENMYTAVMANLQKGKKEKIYRKELNEDWISKLYVFKMEGLCCNDIIPKSMLSSADFFKEIFIYHIRGIANAKGIEIMEKHLQNNDVKE